MTTVREMSPARWKRVEALFHDALARSPADRAAFLAAACPDDEALRLEVQSLVDERVSDDGMIGRADVVAVGAAAAAAAHLPMTGRMLGGYRLEMLIGAGGMGEVYRARDAKLGRDVAIKILPRALTRDPDRLARFEREARMLAALNHPNICAIYGLEESDGITFLILEFVDGETLAHKLGNAPTGPHRSLPTPEALVIAQQIAEALEAAHEKGMVHRDLKPANITITHAGVVKVLDFGLAKPVGDSPVGDITQSPTITHGGTREGVILGTAAYMSPEQARGKPVDKRADIWAFGCVLYEMLTGRVTFAGDTVSDTIGKILEREPDWAALPVDTPAGIRRLLFRCLIKDPKRRLRDIGDVRLEIGAADEEAALPDAAAPLRSARTGSRWLPWMLAGALAIGLAAMIAWNLSRPAPTSSVTRFTIVPPDAPPFAGTTHLLSLSPDGTEIMYTSTNRIFRRPMSSLAAEAFTSVETQQVLNDPVFSPDGRSILFYAHGDRSLRRMPIAGGASTTLGHADAPFGISWGPDGILVGQGATGILRISPSDGGAETIVRVKDGEFAHGPQLLPGGSHVLFTLATGFARDRWDQAQIVVQSLATGERRTLIAGGSDARYVATGHILYAVSGVVYAVAFDAKNLAIRGDAIPVLQGVSRSAGGATGSANFAVSSNGTLAYVPGPVSSTLVRLALTDRRGAVELLNAPPGSYLFPRVSPDGTRFLYGTDDGKEAVIFARDLSPQGASQRLTFGGNNRYPVWTSQSQRIAFQSDREDDLAIWQATDNSGTAERLTRPQPGESHEPESWSPASDTLLFSVRKGADVSLWTYSFRTRSAAPFGAIHSHAVASPNAAFSRDGRWVAYATNENGRTTISVQPFPATGAKYQLLAKGADDPHHPLWSADGRELYYTARPGAFESVGIATSPFAFGNASAVPSAADLAKADHGLFLLGPPGQRRMFDVTPDGRFLGVILGAGGQTGAGAAPHIEVVLNWFEELKAITARGLPSR